MDDKKLYSQILGLSLPWIVTSVDLNLINESVTVSIAYDRNKCSCPICQQECSIYDRRPARSWRHLDTCQMRTIISGSIPRIKCPLHGVKSVATPLSDSYSHFTYLFESYAINLLQATQNQTKAASILRISFSEMHDIMKKSVDRGLKRRRSKDIEYIGIDEKSMKKGHKYMTIVTDFSNKSVLDLCEGRTLETTEKFLFKLKEKHNFLPLKAASIDMWKAYISSIHNVFPSSDIVHDRFHIMKYLNDAVNKTRISESKGLLKHKDDTLKQTKYLYLKNEENMTETQVARFSRIKDLDLKTSKAWRIKETFKAFFDCDTVNKAKSFFSQWLLDVRKEGISHMVKVAEMLRTHIEGLVSYSKHQISNGIAENVNGRIQRIKTVGRGFRAFKNYRTVILFHLGKLDLLPHRSS